MSLLSKLWKDESGLVLSAETVTIGTVGVLGTLVGLNAASTAVNDELKEMASAFRSLDQSYAFAGHRGCWAWTAGSCYIQPDIQQSLAEINSEGQGIKALQERVEEERRSVSHPTPTSQTEPAVTPVPNQIPIPQPKVVGEPTVVPQRKD